MSDRLIAENKSVQFISVSESKKISFRKPLGGGKLKETANAETPDRDIIILAHLLLLPHTFTHTLDLLN